jgi:hypothetical protein
VAKDRNMLLGGNIEEELSADHSKSIGDRNTRSVK